MFPPAWKRSEGFTINRKSLLPSCINCFTVFYITFLKASNFAFSMTWLKITSGNGKFIHENNKTACFTLEINLRKFETACPRRSASKFPLSAVSFFTRFSNTASCHWLLTYKIRRSLSLYKSRKKSSNGHKKKLKLFAVFLWFVENLAVLFL